MKISSRFSIAVHIVLILAVRGSSQKMTSDFLASCIFVNPVVIRRILGQLKKAEIADVKSGEGGAFLLKDVSDLTLFDIYQAVEVVEDVSLFNSHKGAEMKCPVDCHSCPKLSGGNDVGGTENENCPSTSSEACCYIHSSIEDHLLSAQKAMEESLKRTTVHQMIEDMMAAIPKELNN
ncbi:Rrf2 family transcriptional regulator [Methanimicrococcus sp. OttesenSCG-928-J09]|nr:Rrf2 family transcriptional regulator [Methanimicrococcus sp. OttesenSCG-928-J09]